MERETGSMGRFKLDSWPWWKKERGGREIGRGEVGGGESEGSGELSRPMFPCNIILIESYIQD